MHKANLQVKLIYFAFLPSSRTQLLDWTDLPLQLQQSWHQALASKLYKNRQALHSHLKKHKEIPKKAPHIPQETMHTKIFPSQQAMYLLTENGNSYRMYTYSNYKANLQ